MESDPRSFEPMSLRVDNMPSLLFTVAACICLAWWTDRLDRARRGELSFRWRYETVTAKATDCYIRLGDASRAKIGSTEIYSGLLTAFPGWMLILLSLSQSDVG